jgi:hypothetical protein
MEEAETQHEENCDLLPQYDDQGLTLQERPERRD